MVISIVME